MSKNISKDEALKAVKTITKEISESSLEQEALEAVRTLILWAGDDPEREGLIETPDRVARAYQEFFAGYHDDPEDSDWRGGARGPHRVGHSGGLRTDRAAPGRATRLVMILSIT